MSKRPGRWQRALSAFRAEAATASEPITMTQLIDLLGLSGVDRDHLSEATYYACIRILAESVGKLPLKLQKTAPEGGVQEYSEGPRYNVLRLRPNPYQTASVFWSSMEAAKHHDGNALAIIRGAGARTTLWQVPWSQVKVYRDDAALWGEPGKVWYVCSDIKTGKDYRFESSEVLHLTTSISVDGVTGVPVRDRLGKVIKGANTAQAMTSKLYENGFVAKAVLQYTGDLDSDKEKRLVEKIAQFAEGKVDASRSVIPLPFGMTLQPLNIKLTDAQFVEVRKMSALQIAAAFGIKPQQINDFEKASYASAEAQQLSFYVDTLLYHLKNNEEEIAYKLVGAKDLANGVRPKFNVNMILRADIKTQMESLTTAVQHGIYTPNEARAMLDFGNLPGGNELYMNGATIRMTDVGKQYERDTT